jgi:hypothetical protein
MLLEITNQYTAPAWVNNLISWIQSWRFSRKSDLEENYFLIE